MSQILLFLIFSGLIIIALIAADYFKKTSFKSLVGLFLFGILISIPFIMVEFMGGQLKYYFVILAFIAIELGIIFSEHRVKFFHDLIHHNIKELRFMSFLLIGLGFTYSEISFTILHHHGPIDALVSTLPFKTVFSLLTHTVLASAASITHIGRLFSKTIYETVIKLVSYYSRIVMISVSHFLYVLSNEQNLKILIGVLLGASLLAFIYLKKKIDTRPETI